MRFDLNKDLQPVDALAMKACDKPCLACLERGLRVQVLAVEGDDAMAQRLLDQGLWAGTTVELLTKAPLGDPLLFRVHGFRLALRRDEAARVLVAPATIA